MSDTENTSEEVAANESFVLLLAEAKELAAKFLNKTLTEDERNRLVNVIDPQMDALIREGLKDTDIPYSSVDPETGEPVSIRGSIMEQALLGSDIDENLRSMEKLGTYMGSGDIDKNTIEVLISRTPALNGFDIDDAVNLVSGGEEELATRQKFSGANQDTLMAFAYALLDTRRPEIAEEHREFALEHWKTDFAELASTNILYSAQDGRAYQDWEIDQRVKIIDRVSSDPEIMGALAQIKSPANITSLDEAIEQYKLKAQVADAIGEAFAEVYGMPTLEGGDIHIYHASLREQLGDLKGGTAWDSTIPGTTNDEVILINHNPLSDLLSARDTKFSDSGQRMGFLHTVVEELQHTTDMIHVDRLANGQMPPDHPAFDHTVLAALNRVYYSADPANLEAYKNQFVERTAKAVADDISFEIVFRLDNPETIESEIKADATVEQTFPDIKI